MLSYLALLFLLGQLSGVPDHSFIRKVKQSVSDDTDLGGNKKVFVQIVIGLS